MTGPLLTYMVAMAVGFHPHHLRLQICEKNDYIRLHFIIYMSVFLTVVA